MQRLILMMRGDPYLQRRYVCSSSRAQQCIQQGTMQRGPKHCTHFAVLKPKAHWHLPDSTAWQAARSRSWHLVMHATHRGSIWVRWFSKSILKCCVAHYAMCTLWKSPLSFSAIGAHNSCINKATHESGWDHVPWHTICGSLGVTSCISTALSTTQRDFNSPYWSLTPPYSTVNAYTVESTTSGNHSRCCACIWVTHYAKSTLSTIRITYSKCTLSNVPHPYTEALISILHRNIM